MRVWEKSNSSLKNRKESFPLNHQISKDKSPFYSLSVKCSQNVSICINGKNISRSLSLLIIFCMSYLLTSCELHYLLLQKYDYEREKNKTCGEDFDFLSTNAVKMTQSILGKTSQKDIALVKIPVFILDSFSCQLARMDQIVEGGMMSLQRLSESLFKSPISKRATKTAFFYSFCCLFSYVQ